MTVKRWQVGEHVTVRSMWGQRIQAALPMTVIVDSEHVLALYLAAGTQIKIRNTYPTIRLPTGDWEPVDDVWTDDLVRIMYTGDCHAYYATWKDCRFRDWYINLESVYERTSIGVDFTDHILDIVIQPDLVSWKWKDEDELAEAVSLNLVSQSQADSFYSEGKRAVERLELRTSPFSDGWEKWSPDPEWPIPLLSPAWQLRAG